MTAAHQPHLTDEHHDAARFATEAGHLLLGIRRGLAEGIEAREVRRAGDQGAHTLLLQRLGEGYPADAVLSEEGVDDPMRLGAERVWVVDPLDGTREFGEAGRSDWAVHVALVVGGRPVVGAVALPAAGVTLRTQPPSAAPPAREGPPRIVVSRSRPPAIAQHLARVLGGELVELGSAGAKAMAVVRGDADVYAHAGGQYEWDSAAPVAVALAAGLHASRLDGSELRYNRPDPWLPDLLVCRPELADRVLTAIASA